MRCERAASWDMLYVLKAATLEKDAGGNIVLARLTG
jgi:hypothetical protein